MNADVNALPRQLGIFVRRFHTIIFFIVVSVGLAAAVLTLLSIITKQDTNLTTANDAISSGFDQSAIDLVTTGGKNGVSERGDRASPFAE